MSKKIKPDFDLSSYSSEQMAHLGIQPPGICTANGWYWYCDEHDSHGNADEREEALFIATAHKKWWGQAGDPECYLSMGPVGEFAELLDRSGR